MPASYGVQRGLLNLSYKEKRIRHQMLTPQFIRFLRPFSGVALFTNHFKIYILCRIEYCKILWNAARRLPLAAPSVSSRGCYVFIFIFNVNFPPSRGPGPSPMEGFHVRFPCQLRHLEKTINEHLALSKRSGRSALTRKTAKKKN